MNHAEEFRRCLLTADVAGIMKVWAHVAPHLAQQTPLQAEIALHMARVEAVRIPRRLKEYSIAWLDERGYRKVDGQWIEGPPPASSVVEAAGIASKSSDPRVAARIVRAMEDAYLNARAKGIDDPVVQRELMLRERARQRFKMRLA